MTARAEGKAPKFVESGRLIWLDEPELSDFELSDVELGLWSQPRFGGQVPGWNVLRHLALCGRLASHALPSDLPRRRGAVSYAYWHDGEEAFLPDAPPALSMLLGGGWRELKARWRDRVMREAGLRLEAGAEAAVKPLDVRCMALEVHASRWSGRSGSAERAIELIARGSGILGLQRHAEILLRPVEPWESEVARAVQAAPRDVLWAELLRAARPGA